NASCTPGLVHASVGDASGRSVPDARTVICLFLPFRADCCSPKKLRNLLICGEFAMARPGLEPGTPRFSVVRSLGLNPVDLQGIQPRYADPSSVADFPDFAAVCRTLRQTTRVICLFIGRSPRPGPRPCVEVFRTPAGGSGQAL